MDNTYYQKYLKYKKKYIELKQNYKKGGTLRLGRDSPYNNYIGTTEDDYDI